MHLSLQSTAGKRVGECCTGYCLPEAQDRAQYQLDQEQPDKTSIGHKRFSRNVDSAVKGEKESSAKKIWYSYMLHGIRLSNRSLPESQETYLSEQKCKSSPTFMTFCYSVISFPLGMQRMRGWCVSSGQRHLLRCFVSGNSEFRCLSKMWCQVGGCSRYCWPAKIICSLGALGSGRRWPDHCRGSR